LRIALKEYCGLCKSHTWCGNPCRYAPHPAELAMMVGPTSVTKPIPVGVVEVVAKAVHTEHTPPKVHRKSDRPKFDRTAYQRELMRKRRAKAKKKP